MSLYSYEIIDAICGLMKSSIVMDFDKLCSSNVMDVDKLSWMFAVHPLDMDIAVTWHLSQCSGLFAAVIQGPELEVGQSSNQFYISSAHVFHSVSI